MNYFPGSRSPIANPSPFYNPQKDTLNPNNPSLYQNNNNVPSFISSNANSKSFISRSNIIDLPKAANNTSAYIKNANDPSTQPSKFINQVTSPTNFTGNFPNFQPYQSKIASSEMVKSSFYDSKATESTVGYSPQADKVPFSTNTPTRRAPRMS